MNVKELRERASELGVTGYSRMSKAELSEAITEAEQEPRVIQITRHVPGPPRRTPGQVLRISRSTARKQGLKPGRDFREYRDRMLRPEDYERRSKSD